LVQDQPVHASGVGKVNLLFVKDGIGNWNLKNFENYPGELLDAYLNVGKKALEAAAKIAAASSGVGSGGVAIEAALKYANQSIADFPSTSSGTQILEDLAAIGAFNVEITKSRVTSYLSRCLPIPQRRSCPSHSQDPAKRRITVESWRNAHALKLCICRFSSMAAGRQHGLHLLRPHANQAPPCGRKSGPARGKLTGVHQAPPLRFQDERH
jgi:hypothetical protein